MKNLILFIGTSIALVVMFASCQKQFEETDQQKLSQNELKAGVPQYEEIVAVANRGSGSISFVDAESDMVLTTLSIPGSQPMYVVYVPSKDRLYVGDRAQNKIHVIDPDSREVENSIDVGNGVFHMWAGGKGDQLWVNNDIDQTVSVIDLNSNSVTETINIGSKPHDVFVTNDGTKAYVSILNPDDTPDQVFMYSTSTFQKTGEQTVGKDPHLFHIFNKDKLYVPCQSGDLYALDEDDLSELSNNAYPGAHGIFGAPNQQTIFVSNLPGAQLYSISTKNETLNGTPVGTDAIPHNIVANKNGKKLFVTHSGATANTLSVYTISPQQELTYSTTITIETNPFGLAYYKRHKN